MATKSARVIELEDGIAEAVATLDECDGSRIGLQEAFDSAREILKDAYGVGFEKAVSDFVLDTDENEEGDDEADEDSDDD